MAPDLESEMETTTENRKRRGYVKKRVKKPSTDLPSKFGLTDLNKRARVVMFSGFFFHCWHLYIWFGICRVCDCPLKFIVQSVLCITLWFGYFSWDINAYYRGKGFEI